jgi:hypothetical protein
MYVPQHMLSHMNHTPDPTTLDTLCFWPDVDHWTPKNLLFLRAQAEDTRHYMLSGRHFARLLQMAIHWDDSGDIRIPKSFWVRGDGILYSNNCSHASSDFFPVIITFLRQLPFIGTALSLPYIRVVSIPNENTSCSKHLFYLGGGSDGWFTDVCCMIPPRHSYRFGKYRRTWLISTYKEGWFGRTSMWLKSIGTLYPSILTAVVLLRFVLRVFQRSRLHSKPRPCSQHARSIFTKGSKAQLINLFLSIGHHQATTIQHMLFRFSGASNLTTTPIGISIIREAHRITLTPWKLSSAVSCYALFFEEGHQFILVLDIWEDKTCPSCITHIICTINDLPHFTV